MTVTDMFRELIREGHIKPVEHMETLRLPGELDAVPSRLTYGTAPAQNLGGGGFDAKLEQRT